MTIQDVLHDEDEERYNTVGEFSPGSILFVVHTLFADEKDEEVIRLISARAATCKERKPYEEAHKRAAAASRRHRRRPFMNIDKESYRTCVVEILKEAHRTS